MPFGSYKRSPTRATSRAIGRVFRDWEFTVGDLEAISLEQADFVYADPPYDVEFPSIRRPVLLGRPGANGEWLSRHRGPVILVNQATERVADLYKELGYRVSYLDAPRRSRARATERRRRK